MVISDYRFLVRPRWLLFHVVVSAAIVTMVNLGLWQLRRLDERQAFNATIEARYDAPPTSLDKLLATLSAPDGYDSIEWLPVTAAGIYLPEAQLRVVNRSQYGRAGDNLITPLRLADGRILLINRGFIPLGIDSDAPAPTGSVEVTGRVRVSQSKGFGQLADSTDAKVNLVQRVDIPLIEQRFAEQLGGEVVPVYIDLIDSTPTSRNSDGLPEPVIKPELGEGNHLSYAVQWFIFSAAVLAGWVLAVRRSTQSRRQRAGETPGVSQHGEHRITNRYDRQDGSIDEGNPVVPK